MEESIVNEKIIRKRKLNKKSELFQLGDLKNLQDNISEKTTFVSISSTTNERAHSKEKVNMHRASAIYAVISERVIQSTKMWIYYDKLTHNWNTFYYHFQE
nr:ORF61 [Bracoviriform inaniti]